MTEDLEKKALEEKELAVHGVTPEEYKKIVRKQIVEKLGISEEQLEAWKADYGKVVRVMLGDESFLIRPLSRLENKQMNTDLQVGQNASEMEWAAAYEEALIRRCVLAPKITVGDYTASRAGTFSSLKVAIQFYSNFLSPEFILASCDEI